MKFLSEKISKKDIISALKIYNFYISNSLANFEEKKLTIKDFLLLYKKIRINKLPFILLKNDDVVAGIYSLIILMVYKLFITSSSFIF